MKYSLLIHCNNSCTNAPQMLRYTYIGWLVSFKEAVLLIHADQMDNYYFIPLFLECLMFCSMDVLVVRCSKVWDIFWSYVPSNVVSSLVFIFTYLHTILRALEVDNTAIWRDPYLTPLLHALHPLSLQSFNSYTHSCGIKNWMNRLVTQLNYKEYPLQLLQCDVFIDVMCGHYDNLGGG